MHQPEAPQSETDDAWGLEVAMVGQPPADSLATASDPDDGTAGPQVLARMPDLDAAEPNAEAGKSGSRWDGRMISQRLSMKLLVGGGLVLVLAAIAPFVLSNKGNRNRDDGLPDWHQGMPAPHSEEAPVWSPATVQTPPQTPAGGPPPSPQVASPQPPPIVPPQLPKVPGRPNLAPRPAAYANQPRTIEDRGGSPTDHPREYQPRLRLPVEPGVARFEGTIRKPSVRTSYDRDRSSIR